jgi:16S rRNA (uracil1498-N3)-methyltransferase
MSLRVFHRGPMRTGDIVTLDDQEAHYLLRVRRARPGDRVEILDGIEAAFAGEVVDAGAIRIGQPIDDPATPPVQIAIGLPDPRATLEALARAFELAATTAVLVRCERSHHVAPSSARIERVLAAAQRQCGRPRAMPVEGPLPLDTWLARPGPGYVAWTKMRGQPTSVDPCSPDGTRVLVGPEGGLADDEVERARALGLRPLSLGPWTLRTEVAVIAALSRLVR